jgi:hypothetical protein
MDVNGLYSQKFGETQVLQQMGTLGYPWCSSLSHCRWNAGSLPFAYLVCFLSPLVLFSPQNRTESMLTSPPAISMDPTDSASAPLPQSASSYPEPQWH